MLFIIFRTKIFLWKYFLFCKVGGSILNLGETKLPGHFLLRSPKGPLPPKKGKILLKLQNCRGKVLPVPPVNVLKTFSYLNIIQVCAAYMVPNALRITFHPIFVIIFITFLQIALSTSGTYFFSWTSHCIVFCCFLWAAFHSYLISVLTKYFFVFCGFYILLLASSCSFL